jgi:hypothetical protein
MNLSEPEWVLTDQGIWHYYEADSESVCGEPMPGGRPFTSPDEPFDTTCAKCSRIAKEHACLGPLARKIIEYLQDRCHSQEDLTSASKELVATHKYGLLTKEEFRLISEIGRRRRKELKHAQEQDESA